jgi:5-aminolevulinate synthase
MDGSICDMNKMCDITHKYGGISYIDEVHAVGLYGHNGAGIGERDNVLNKMDIITGTLGKAFGNIGGYIAGSSNLIDMIRSYGSGFIFTTSLPPSVIAGSLAAIEISKSNEGRQLRSLHQLYATIVKTELKKFPFLEIFTPNIDEQIIIEKTSDIKGSFILLYCNKLTQIYVCRQKDFE